MNWMKKIYTKNTLKISHKANIPNDIWKKCENCKTIIYYDELKKNLLVCPKCDFHMKISARCRLYNFLDKDSLYEFGQELEPKDILNFKDSKRYKDRLIEAQKTTHEKDALIIMKGTLYTIPVVAASFEFSFIGGSMSSAVGAKFVLAVNTSLKYNCPLICFITSGGARMQESLISLMQMARTSAALAKLHIQKIPYISILTNPTMGGVSASLGMLGDLNIAEPKALIGFAGPRVIEQTVREKLPDSFQKSEFLLEKGALDLIIHRQEMRKRIANIIAKLINYPFSSII